MTITEVQIRIANRRTLKLLPGETEVYVGRNRADEAPNPLGNPFPVAGKGRWTRATDDACRVLIQHAPNTTPEQLKALAQLTARLDTARQRGGFAHGEAAELYLPYLRACYVADLPPARALKRLVQRLLNGERLVLVCWCAPNNPCHAQAIEHAARQLVALWRNS